MIVISKFITCDREVNLCAFIHSFSRPAYPWGVAGAAAPVGASKHLDPLQQRINQWFPTGGEFPSSGEFKVFRWGTEHLLKN